MINIIMITFKEGVPYQLVKICLLLKAIIDARALEQIFFNEFYFSIALSQYKTYTRVYIFF